MNFLRNIFGRVMAFWALVVFTLSMLIFVIPVGLSVLWPEPKRSRVAYFFYTKWMWLFFVLSGVRRRIVGREHFRRGENYVVICNHNSLMDPPLSSPAIPGANKTIAKAEMAKIPIFGIVYSRGSVLVDRKSEESRRASFGKMKEVLQQGLHMCIYPEGTRNKTKEPLQRFHDGAFRLAIDAQKRIIPALLFNTRSVLPRKGFFFWPTKVEMHFLPPIESANKSAQALKEEAFALMKDYYLLHRKNIEQ
jgi:1-acyl-sn-glycerol-3-phosphate acyltransferase